MLAHPRPALFCERFTTSKLGSYGGSVKGVYGIFGRKSLPKKRSHLCPGARECGACQGGVLISCNDQDTPWKTGHSRHSLDSPAKPYSRINAFLTDWRCTLPRSVVCCIAKYLRLKIPKYKHDPRHDPAPSMTPDMTPPSADPHAGWRGDRG